MAPNNKKSNPVSPTITLEYIKSAGFHSIQADGVVGGVTPNGHIHMAFFNERTAIPRRVVYELKADGTLGPIQELDTRDSIIREMSVDVFMTYDAAKGLHTWLEEVLKTMESGNARENKSRKIKKAKK